MFELLSHALGCNYKNNIVTSFIGTSMILQLQSIYKTFLGSVHLREPLLVLGAY